MEEIIFVVEESPDGGYFARALGQSIFTDAETIPELKENIKDAIKCHFEETDKPKIIQLHFIRNEMLAIA